MPGEDDEREFDGDLESDFDDDEDFLGSSGGADQVDGGAGPGPGGLTEDERELADELNRRRDIASTRDRFLESAGLSPVGGGRRNGTPSERDALAIIDAAGRFGEVETTEVDQEERDAIAELLADHASRDPIPPGEFIFPAVVTSQSLTKGGDIKLTMTVPWTARQQVFDAMERMPFSCHLRMNEIRALDE